MEVLKFKKSNRETFRREKPAVILSIVMPVPDMLVELHNAERRLISISHKGSAKDILDAAKIIEIMRSKILNYAKSLTL